MIPAPLVVVTVGMALERYFDLDHEHVYMFMPDHPILPHHEFTIGPKFLVSIPDNILSSFYFPDFGKWATREFWAAVVAICLVGSLETLLSATAVDKLDPWKRSSDLNRDLTAVGIGNLLASAVGGLPMIAEIVRSSANINDGARTSWSNFFHGSFLALFVVFFPRLIHEIPLASLAALLVYTGFRLASPKEFAKTMVIGKEQLLVFTTTLVAVLATDLLVGVFIGILLKLIIQLSRGVPLRELLKISYSLKNEEGGVHRISIQGSAIFANFIGLKSELASMPQGETIIFDVANVSYIDHTVMEFLHHFQNDYVDRGGRCEIRGLDKLAPYSKHPLAARRHARAGQA
jgi:MFS superfamily sulfate permease-like transporter